MYRRGWGRRPYWGGGWGWRRRPMFGCGCLFFVLALLGLCTMFGTGFFRVPFFYR